MTEQDFPALYRSADKLSLNSQKFFFCILGTYLSVLVIASILSAINIQGKWIAVIQLIALIVALACSFYLWIARDLNVIGMQGVQLLSQ